MELLKLCCAASGKVNAAALRAAVVHWSLMCEVVYCLR